MGSRNTKGAIGVGAMILFIAMVLVAGFAAFVLITTSNQLELKSTETGTQTISDVSTGIKITSIQGHNTSGKIDKVIISVTPQAGSLDVDLSSTLIELSNTSMKCVLNYSSLFWVDGTSGVSDLYGVSVFPTLPSQFGVIVVKDDDDSCQQNSPVVNRGDSVLLAVNSTAVFNGIPAGTNVFGHIIPKNGAWGIIEFRTPTSITNAVLLLQ